MRHWKRLFYYLMINVLVSACTVFAVLSLWERTRPPATEGMIQLAQFRVSPTRGVTNEAGEQSSAAISETAVPPSDPTDTPEADPTRPVTQYQVQSGDTLGAVATKFGVSIEDLMEANQLIDPNRLDVGQTLIIPRQAQPPDARTSLPVEETATPAPTVEPTSQEVPVEPPRVIIDGVIGAGDLASERIFLKRTGGGELTMVGWQLLEEGGNVFTFPQFKLFESGAVYLYTRAGQDTPVQLYWGLSAPVWQSGETVILLDAEGEVHTTYRVP